MTSASIALFTRDLRVHDNPVLHAAAAAGRCIPLFVLDDAITTRPFNRPNRAAFLADSLKDLDAGLRGLGGHLVLRRGAVVEEVLRLVRDHAVGEVHVAADVSGFAHRREDALREALGREGVALHVHEASITAVAPRSVTPSGGNDHFAVFTPYFRKWSGAPKRGVLRPPGRLTVPRLRSAALPTPDRIRAGDRSPDLARGGEVAGRELMARWVAEAIDDYEALHDDMAGEGTSRLSPHLHFGTVSVTELLHRAGTGSAGARAFTRQLAWRDFHHQVLAARPECATEDYRPRADRWRRPGREFEAWCSGRTGYPIVDAGMRQLAREGWLHNRARLIVGSFLTKTLYLDWRLGARHFTELLVDCDVANNQLNWQWVAGTGTDSRPNRVLNPVLQAHRYDPSGDYVRRYVPELRDIPGPAVHEPWKLSAAELAETGYPRPLVDLRDAAERFKNARANNREGA
ncbi:MULTISPECIES: cryptochrome/photolyase family protein [unclassified Amycolatopsis]|uniref:cryptochrome/photolyase family protein n=1 Tax=unclassified Amycolatopsis TaxID=2618356 RepID=UPI002E1A72AF|nr:MULTISPECIES: deoxyribodipyrimidine photo-lyase [unclassified Amycolatopsis]